MTKNEKRIKQVLSEYDLTSVFIAYDRRNGWVVKSNNGHFFVGLNIGELIDDIRFEMEVKSTWN